MNDETLTILVEDTTVIVSLVEEQPQLVTLPIAIEARTAVQESVGAQKRFVI